MAGNSSSAESHFRKSCSRNSFPTGAVYFTLYQIPCWQRKSYTSIVITMIFWVWFAVGFMAASVYVAYVHPE
jgi:hypothetical protein